MAFNKNAQTITPPRICFVEEELWSLHRASIPEMGMWSVLHLPRSADDVFGISRLRKANKMQPGWGLLRETRQYNSLGESRQRKVQPCWGFPRQKNRQAERSTRTKQSPVRLTQPRNCAVRNWSETNKKYNRVMSCERKGAAVKSLGMANECPNEG